MQNETNENDLNDAVASPFEPIVIRQFTRDDARELFEKSGLTYADLTKSNIQKLRNLINLRMKESGVMDGTFRCKQRAKFCYLENGSIRHAGLRCKSHYFDDRETVSFNPDGFIGFAGWSDDTNIKPILNGFKDWVESILP
ncbi:MAG: hypothetical protein OEY89_17385 [Gammaproteobacteria bacterium]|nr:hypothetical protein [Gammaproteobacteria bacterium]